MDYTLMLAHAKPEMVEACLENHRTTMAESTQLVMVNQYYPLPDKFANTVKCKSLAEKYGAIWLDHRLGTSIGCSAGWRYFMSQVRPKPQDRVIFRDPDTRVGTFSWDVALLMTCSPEYPVVSLMTQPVEGELVDRGFHYETTPAGYRLAIPDMPCALGVTCVHVGTFEAMGGYRDNGGLYGGLEGPLWNSLAAIGKRFVYLTDYWEIYWPHMGYKGLIDAEYRNWKIDYVYNGYRGSFDEYCQQKGLL